MISEQSSFMAQDSSPIPKKDLPENLLFLLLKSQRENWHKVVQELSTGRIQMGNKDEVDL